MVRHFIKWENSICDKVHNVAGYFSAKPWDVIVFPISVSATTALRVDIGAFNEQLQEAINKALEIDAIMLIGNST